MSREKPETSRFVVLLPVDTSREEAGDKGKDQTPTWTAVTDSSFVGIPRDMIRTNLVSAESISAHGVSHPWSPALAFRYCLEHSTTESVELLRLMLLARYLGALEDKTRMISLKSPNGAKSSMLEQILVSALPAVTAVTDVELRLLVWHRGATERLAPIVAAGVSPEWYLFPTTTYQTAEGLADLRKALLEGRAQGLFSEEIELRDNKPEIKDATIRSDFYHMIRALKSQANRVRTPWVERLEQIAQNSKSADGSPPAFPDKMKGTFPTRARGQAWACRQHDSKDSGLPWNQDAGMETARLDADHPALVCMRHTDCVVVHGDSPVGLERFGAALHTWPTGKKELLIWTDTERDENIRIVNETDSGLVVQYGQGPRIELHGKKMSLGDVCCEPASIPPMQLRGAADQATSTIPILCEYLDLIEGSPSWNKGTRQWTVKLKGRLKAVDLPAPAGEAGGDFSGVVVWPKERDPRWCLDVVGVYLQYLDQAALVYRRDGAHLQLSPFKPLPLIEDAAAGCVEYIATMSDPDKQRGAIWLGRPTTNRRRVEGRIGYIAVDFGTSNTVVRFKVEHAVEAENEHGSSCYVMNGVQDYLAACYSPTSGADFPQSLVTLQRIFSAWYSTDSPSPLVSTLLWDKSDSDDRPIMSSVVPREPLVMANIQKDSGGVFHGNLKWNRMAEFDRGALSTYLLRVLSPAYLELARCGVDKIRIAASYPFAFSDTRKHEFKNALRSTINSLGERTDVAITAESPVLYSESYAGTRRGIGQNADYRITIDMGGGTTDIAVLGPLRDDANGKKAFLAADSLNIGARKLMKALQLGLSDEELQACLVQALNSATYDETGGQRSIDMKHRDLIMESLMQEGYREHLEAHFAPRVNSQGRSAVAALLAGIAVAADRLLGAVIPQTADGNPPLVQFAFLGQGWHLLRSRLLSRHFSEKRFLEVVGDLGRDRYRLTPLFAGADNPDSSLARKLEIARGTMLLMEANEPEDAYEKSSFVGMDLQLGDGGKLSASTRLGEGRVAAFATGDPGFDALIEELVDVATKLPENGGEFRDGIRGRIEMADLRFNGESNKALLIGRACASLNDLLKANDDPAQSKRVLARSPLIAFLSGPWLGAWGLRED